MRRLFVRNTASTEVTADKTIVSVEGVIRPSTIWKPLNIKKFTFTVTVAAVVQFTVAAVGQLLEKLAGRALVHWPKSDRALAKLQELDRPVSQETGGSSSCNFAKARSNDPVAVFVSRETGKNDRALANLQELDRPVS